MFESEKIKLGIDKSLILSEHDRFWMITSGEVDVFYVQLDKDGTYLSSTRHLYTAKAGELLFSLLTNEEIEKDIKLLVVSKGASLIALNKNKLLEIDSLYLKSMIEKWVLKISNRLHNNIAPRVYKGLSPLETTFLKKEEIAYPLKGLVWCTIKKGEITKYASKSIQHAKEKFNYPVAVSDSLWITATSENVEVELVNTKEVLKDGIYFMLSLNNLQSYLYNRLIKNFELELKEDHLRIADKVRNEDSNLRKTLHKLRGIVTGNSVKNEFISTNETKKNNNLFATCSLIGKTIGFKFIEPKYMESYQNSTTNQLYAIAQTSKVRVRKIILRGAWWKDENGHLLAFYKDSKQPVALIQNTPNSYLLKDVVTGEEMKVNYEIAERLEPISYMFFFAFNDAMSSVRQILSFASKGIKSDFRFLILAALSGSILGLLVPILSGIMFDDVIPTSDKTLHFEIFTIMIVIGVISAGLHLIQGALQLRVETKSSINLQAGVMDHLLRLPISFYKKYSSGDLTNRALSINRIRHILSSTVMTTVLSGAFSFVNLILLFYYDSSLAWIGVGLALMAVLFLVVIGSFKLKYDRQVSDIQGDLQGFLFEFLSGITKIRITGAEKRIFTLWANKFSKLKELGYNSGNYQNFVEIFERSYPLLTSIFFFGFIYYTVNNSTVTSMISVGAFMAFISAFDQFLRDCLNMSTALINSLNVVTLYERVKPILEEMPESDPESLDPGELVGNIELNSISFRYNEEQPLILDDISFKINHGEMVAFVGTSGSGKSTIMRLLLGFEEPGIGSIYYDGNAFNSMNKDLVRKQIGVVLQNGALMTGSIFDNIVGNSELTLEDAWEAARMAGMEKDIKQMPMGMHTVISEGAGTFSGGQRQRLMIARAIVHKPRLLFMDEATSALDNKTQNIVSESLDKLQATRIVIAHRLSTVINADRIYVLDKGKIVESGSYSELMKQNGVFSKLAKRQIA